MGPSDQHEDAKTRKKLWGCGQSVGVFLEDGGKGSSGFLHHRPVFSFDHYAGHLLGSGVTEEDAAAGTQPFFERQFGILKSRNC